MVILGAFPERDEALGGASGNLAGGGDVLADACHLIAFPGHQGPAFKSEVADVFAIERECAAVAAEILAMLLSESVQSGMALE